MVSTRGNPSSSPILLCQDIVVRNGESIVVKDWSRREQSDKAPVVDDFVLRVANSNLSSKIVEEVARHKTTAANRLYQDSNGDAKDNLRAAQLYVPQKRSLQAPQGGRGPPPPPYRPHGPPPSYYSSYHAPPPPHHYHHGPPSYYPPPPSYYYEPPHHYAPPPSYYAPYNPYEEAYYHRNAPPKAPPQALEDDPQDDYSLADASFDSQEAFGR